MGLVRGLNTGVEDVDSSKNLVKNENGRKQMNQRYDMFSGLVSNLLNKFKNIFLIFKKRV